MTEQKLVGGARPPCPDPSKHRRRSLWRIAIDLVIAAVVIMTAGLLVWAGVGVRAHMMTLVEGNFGTYGVVVIPEILTKEVEVVGFEATRVPSRIIALGPFVRWPVPEVIEVTVQYRGSDKVVRTWGHTYIVACTDKGDSCVTMSRLRVVSLTGCCHPDGKLNERGSLYFPSARPPFEKAIDKVPRGLAAPQGAPPEVPIAPPVPRKPPTQRPQLPADLREV